MEAWQLDRKPTRKGYGSTKSTMFIHDFGLKGQIQGVQPTGSEVRGSRVRQPGTLNLPGPDLPLCCSII